MNKMSAFCTGALALVVPFMTACNAAPDDRDSEPSDATTNAPEEVEPRRERIHVLDEAPDAFGTWVRATTPEARKYVSQLVEASGADGDEVTGALYLPRGSTPSEAGPGLPHVVYVGNELGVDDVSAQGPTAYVRSFAREQLSLDMTMFPTDRPLGGALGCQSTENQGISQVVCLWASPGVLGTAIFNLDSPRTPDWAAEQTRELRQDVEAEAD